MFHNEVDVIGLRPLEKRRAGGKDPSKKFRLRRSAEEDGFWKRFGGEIPSEKMVAEKEGSL